MKTKEQITIRMKRLSKEFDAIWIDYGNVKRKGAYQNRERDKIERFLYTLQHELKQLSWVSGIRYNKFITSYQ